MLDFGRKPRSERNGAKGRGDRSRPATRAKAKDQQANGFWHQPTLLNLTADLLIIVSSAAFAWAAVIALQRLPFFPLREVTVLGDFSHVSRAQVELATRGAVKGNFFTVNLESTRNAFEKLPWVRRVEVRRRWPDAIDVAIEEHVPVAQWRTSDGEPKLVNTYGDVFPAIGPASLPVFAGPEGSSARVLARYQEFDKALSGIGRHPRVVVLSAREAWQLRLDDGLVLDLGRDQNKQSLTERMSRFTQYYRTAAAKSRMSIAAVDMRYPNGFTLRPARGDKGNS